MCLRNVEYGLGSSLVTGALSNLKSSCCSVLPSPSRFQTLTSSSVYSSVSCQALIDTVSITTFFQTKSGADFAPASITMTGETSTRLVTSTIQRIPFRTTCLVPYVDAANAPPAVREKLSVLPFRRNVFLLLGHSPGLFPPLMGSHRWSL